MSIRAKTALTIILVAFIVSAVSFFSNLNFATKSLIETMWSEQKIVRDIADKLVSTKIDLLTSNALLAAKQLSSVKNAAEWPGVMAKQLKEFPDFTALAISSNGTVLASLGTASVPESFLDKQHDVTSLNEGHTITTTQRDPLTDQLVIYIREPMGNNMFLTATLQAEVLSNFFSDYRIWKSGAIYIIDNEGAFIVHFEKERIEKRLNFIELAKTDPTMKSTGEFFKNMLVTREGEGIYYAYEMDRVCSYKHISSDYVDWVIGVVAPVEESPVANVRFALLFSSLIIFAVTAIAAYLISGFLVRPYHELEKLTNTIKEQAALIQLEHNRANLLLNGMPLACNLWDENLAVMDCNDDAPKLFKLKSKDEFIKRLHEFYPEYQPDGQLSNEKMNAYLKKALEGERCVFEWIHQLPDGTLLPVEITLVRLNFGTKYAVAAYKRDLREQKQMMNEIGYRDMLLVTVTDIASTLINCETEEFERILHNCLNILASTVDIDCISIWKKTDDAICYTQLYEWSNISGFLQNENVASLISHSENLRKSLRQGTSVQILTRDMSPEAQALLYRKGILSIYVVPVFLKNQFWGFMEYSNCRSERVFTDNEQTILLSASLVAVNALLRNDMMLKIRADATKLESDITEMGQMQNRLESALMETKKANSAKSSFLASMSHEMRTPLNAIIGLSELTLDTEELDEEIYSNIEKIHKAGSVLLSTVNDILDISKIEAGKLEIVSGDYDIPSLINDTVTQNIMRIGEKPIKLILDIDESIPARLNGDELRVRQIMNNLLSNAFKYTMKGAVELSIRCELKDDTAWMIVQVRDTGIGIKPDDLKKLFSDYTQFDIRSHHKVEGTGLGLSITRKLLALMDGSISVESEYGEGSVFTVRFRQKRISNKMMAPEVVENLKKFQYSDSKRSKSMRFVRVKLPYARVLIVDDIVTNLEVAKGLMKPYGMQIDCVTSGQQAIDLIRNEEVRYNAIFMDHMMPEMDGIEATRIIRETIGTEYAEKIPIIALTANAVVGNEAMFLNNGFQAFLSKPIELSHLDEVIRHWVQDNKQEKLIADSQVNIPPEHEHASTESGDYQSAYNREIAGLDMNVGIQRFGKSSYIEILRSYVTHTPTLLDILKKADSDNLNNYATHVHGIKGSSRGIGAFSVGDAAEALENAAKAGNIDFVNNNNKDFIQMVETLVSDINGFLNDVLPQSNKPKKDKPEREILAKLMTACAKYDMDGVDTTMAEIDAYDYESDDGLICWLRENVSLTNFTQIQEKLLLLTERETL